MILEKFPEFKESLEWKEHLEFWDNEEAGSCNEMSVFSHYINRRLNENASEEEIKLVFDFIEFLMKEGDQATRDVAATCFLENLLNYDSAGRLKAKIFIPFLGEESRGYCIAWDEFTGVKTDGLW